MKQKFNILVLFAAISLAGCLGGNKHSNNNVGATSSNVVDSTVFQNIIIRDSVVVLKYKTQTDTIIFPIINPQFPKLAKSVNPEAVLGQRLYQIKENYKNCGCGYVSMIYKRSFSNSKIISFSFNTVFIGPYPSETTIYQTLTINTGLIYKLTQQLDEAGQGYVLKKYKETLLERLDADKTNHPEEKYNSAYNQIKENINQLTFEAINENYIVKDGSITVKTEPILPHVILAWEINRLVDFSWDDLKAFKKMDANF